MSNSKEDSAKCPICGEDMIFFYGEVWDYDRWLCMRKNDIGLCHGEIELEESTSADDE